MAYVGGCFRMSAYTGWTLGASWFLTNASGAKRLQGELAVKLPRVLTSPDEARPGLTVALE